MKCANCNSNKVRIRKVDFKVHDISLGKFEAEVCSDCGEEVFSEEVSDQIDKIAEEKGFNEERVLSNQDKKAIDATLEAEKNGKLKSMDKVFD